MSIVKGTGGYLTLAGTVLSSNTYTIFIGAKFADVGQFGEILRYDNTASSYLYMACWGGPWRHRLAQQFSQIVTDASNITVDTWSFALAACSSVDQIPLLHTENGTTTAAGSSGTFTTPSSPVLEVLSDSVIGDKIGVIAIYNAKLDSTDRAHLLGGGNPSALPSATPLSEMWIDSSGVVLDGSDNVVTWTGVNGSVLTATGTLTSDELDMAPVSFGGPTVSLASGTIQPGGSFTLEYSNFEGVPTSPVTITDSNSNTITVTVTVDDNGDGTGTATGTMPSLPTGSSSVDGLLFGDVTVELTA